MNGVIPIIVMQINFRLYTAIVVCSKKRIVSSQITRPSKQQTSLLPVSTLSSRKSVQILPALVNRPIPTLLVLSVKAAWVRH